MWAQWAEGAVPEQVDDFEDVYGPGYWGADTDTPSDIERYAEAPVDLLPPLHTQQEWRWDAGFSPEQLVGWQQAEAVAGIKSPSKRARARTAEAALDIQKTVNGYLASKTFRGCIAGFVFGTGTSGTGYYRDLVVGSQPAASSKVTLTLDTLLPLMTCTPELLACNASEGLAPLLPSRRRARRARERNGKRIVRANRNKRAAASFEGEGKPQPSCPQTGLMCERWWPSLGLWAIDSANGNSWKSLAKHVLERSQADIVVGQETKAFTERETSKAVTEARRLGWNPTLTKAHRTGCDMGSGGGAILARKGTGISPVQSSCIPEEYQHRISISWINAILKGGIHGMNIYLRHSEGLSPANMLLLAHAAAALGALLGPWFVGGDWNMSPQELAQSQWLRIVNGVIFATELVTCNESTYDYFVVHRSIAHAVVGAQRIQDGGLNPHWVTRLLMRGDARRLAVRKLVRAEKVPGFLPMGPVLPPPSYKGVVEDAQA
jgi:hypothetical protein